MKHELCLIKNFWSQYLQYSKHVQRVKPDKHCDKCLFCNQDPKKWWRHKNLINQLYHWWDLSGKISYCSLSETGVIKRLMLKRVKKLVCKIYVWSALAWFGDMSQTGGVVSSAKISAAKYCALRPSFFKVTWVNLDYEKYSSRNEG